MKTSNFITDNEQTSDSKVKPNKMIHILHKQTEQPSATDSKAFHHEIMDIARMALKLGVDDEEEVD